MPAAEARFSKALEVLQGQDTVDPERVAAIGYCFGGGMVLHMVRAGMDLDGVASFHGSLGTQSPAQPGRVKASVLVLNGADDPLVPHHQSELLVAALETAQVPVSFYTVAGAGHGGHPGPAGVLFLLPQQEPRGHGGGRHDRVG